MTALEAPLGPHDFPYYALTWHCPVTCWACYSGTCGHAPEDIGIAE